MAPIAAKIPSYITFLLIPPALASHMLCNAFCFSLGGLNKQRQGLHAFPLKGPGVHEYFRHLYSASLYRMAVKDGVASVVANECYL